MKSRSPISPSWIWRTASTWLLACRQVMADRDVQPLLLRLLVGRLHNAIAGCVHGDRFFQEHMLPGLDRRGELRGAETRWRAEQNDVRARRDGFLDRRQDPRTAARRHIDLVVELVLEILVGALDRLGERIGHGDEPDVAVRLVPQRIEGGARASSAATDQRDLDLVAAGGKRGVAKFERPTVAAAAEPLTNCLRETVEGMSCLMRGLLRVIGKGIIWP